MPIVDHMIDELRITQVNHLDDTPAKCQGGKSGKMRQAHLWVFTSPECPNILLQFTPGRGVDGVSPHLVPLEGFLVGDGLHVNKTAAKNAGAKLTLCGCWAHALRKFRDSLKTNRKVAKLYLRDIGFARRSARHLPSGGSRRLGAWSGKEVKG